MNIELYKQKLNAWRATVEDTIKTEGVEATCLWLGYGILREFERIKDRVENLLKTIRSFRVELEDMARYSSEKTVEIPEFFIRYLKKQCDPLLENLYRTKAMLAVSDEFCKSCFTSTHEKYIDRMIEILESYGAKELIEHELLTNELKELADTIHGSAPSVFLCRRK